MNFYQSLVVLLLIVVVFLTFGLAGLVRAVRLLDKRIDESLGEPRRLAVGDRLQLPLLISSHLRHNRTLIAFLRADCKSCRRVARALADRVDRSDVDVVLLWQGAEPQSAAYGDVLSIPNQAETFDVLRVGLTPFAVLIEHGMITLRGAVGSDSSLGPFLDALGAVPSRGETDETEPTTEERDYVDRASLRRPA